MAGADAETASAPVLPSELPGGGPARPAGGTAAGASSTPSQGTKAGTIGNVILYDVHDLKTYFFTYDGIVRALDGVNLTIRRGRPRDWSARRAAARASRRSRSLARG